MFSHKPSRGVILSLVVGFGAFVLGGCGNGASQATGQGSDIASGALSLNAAAWSAPDPVNPYPNDPLHGVAASKAGGLQVQVPWTTFVGTVASLASGTAKDGHQKDGDWQINVQPDPQYQSMINDVNVSDNQGDMVVEVIPEDQATVELPAIGDHIQVWGPQVIDTHHGWEEIHPVRDLVVLN